MFLRGWVDQYSDRRDHVLVGLFQGGVKKGETVAVRDTHHEMPQMNIVVWVDDRTYCKLGSQSYELHILTSCGS